MIDVDERGRAAAADLHRAAAAVADTDGAWQALSGVVAVRPAGTARPPRRRVRWVAAAVGAAAAVTIAVVGLVAADRTDAPPGGLLTTSPTAPGPSSPDSVQVPPTAPPASASPAPDGSGSSTVAPSAAAVADALSSVATAEALPAVVSVGQWPDQVSIDGVPISVPAFPPRFAVQAPDGRLVVTPGGDAFGNDLVYDPATGASTQVPEPADDGMRVASVDDVATLAGVVTVVAVRADPCNTEGAPCSRSELVLLPLDGGQEPQVIVGDGGATIDGRRITRLGRSSLSDTGLLAGVAWLSDTERVALLVDTTVDGEIFGQEATALGRALGLNTGVDDPARRIDAVTVDQRGRAVAWLAADGVTVIDLTSGERRTFALPSLPGSTDTAPVIDLALTGAGIGDGAVLVSSVAEGATWVVDLTDGSVQAIAGFVGSLTFSAAPRG